MISQSDICFERKAATIEYKLIQDCVTRWGSTLSMIERILEHQTAICAVLMENRSNQSLLPTSEEFTVTEELASVLKPI